MSSTTAPAKFVPTAHMIGVAEICFVAIAFEQQVESIVVPYQTKILAERAYSVRDEYLEPMEKGGGAPERILNPDLTYLLSEADFAVYSARCEEERIKAGLVIEKEGQCPLLVARHLTVIAKRELVDSLSPISGVTADQCMCLNFDKYKELVELSLRLTAPFVKSGTEVLQRLMGDAAHGTQSLVAMNVAQERACG